MEIIRGKIKSAKKVVIYGPEGIGKSTFAAQFPEPLFIDTEGSTAELNVARTKRPSSWTMIIEQIKEVMNTPGLCKTLVIDTIDWAENLCIEHVCQTRGKKGIEDFGYGNGYVYTKEEFGQWIEKEGLQAIATRVGAGDECSIIIEDGYSNNIDKKEESVPKFQEGVF